MNENLTELVFILDKSGSMAGLEEDTIGGYNAMLEKQKKEQGEVLLTTVLFDNNYEILHDRINLKNIIPITEREYFVGGSTALLDAIGKTINKIINAHKYIIEEQRPGNVIFVITTDGMENSSQEYSYDKIKAMIKNQKIKFNWEFMFLGANIDAISVAYKFGINEDRATNYYADGEGTALNYKVLCDAVIKIRSGEDLDRSWKSEIEGDLKNRSKRR